MRWWLVADTLKGGDRVEEGGVSSLSEGGNGWECLECGMEENKERS